VTIPQAPRLTGGERYAEPEADLAGALHEVSNTLTVVLGWLDVARARLPEGPEREALSEAIDVARTHARLGHRIARRAIGAELPGSGSSERTADALARCALVAVTPTAQQRGVSIEHTNTAVASSLIRDVGAVLQILTNLLLNAIAFSPVDSTVRLVVSECNDWVVFSVTDSGPGINPDRARSLFAKAGSTRRGGAGIGLRHASALAEAKGGQLVLAHAGPGASFELRWPIAEMRSRARQHPVVNRSLCGFRVLVVEDDAAVRSLIELALEARGAEAAIVGSLPEYDAAIGQGLVFDAALVDLSPFGADVSGALARLHASNPGIRVVLISGLASGVSAEVEEQVALWVRKPFEMGEVIDALVSVLSAPVGVE
jgi:CheY-like chemotaxis protein